MTDCTRTEINRQNRRRLLTIVASTLVLLVALGGQAAPAYADGDPASDVLAVQTLFLPQDAGIPVPEQAQLVKLLQEAAHGGYQLRVALIASPSDLGSITPLWRQPTAYASFLGQELSLTYNGALLVIMPNGFGVFDQGHSAAAQQAALQGVPLHAVGAGLATTAITAIQRLAAAAGHPLALPHVLARNAGGSSDVVAWIVFAAGFVLIVLAWTASLLARPLVARRDLPPPEAGSDPSSLAQA